MKYEGAIIMSMSSALVVLVKSFAVFSVLLFLGMFLRAKVPVLQNLYLPACVIGGFIGLFVGPNMFNLIPFPKEIMGVASSLPGVLIVPILAATPMCLKGSFLKSAKEKDAFAIACIVCFVSFFQFVIGLGVNLVYEVLGGESYKTFGLELPMGFTGGHGMAGVLGNTLHTMGASWWEVAQGMASTSATVGLIGGILIGVYLINMAARKGYTKVVKSVSQVSKEYRVGYYETGRKRPTMGTQTTIPNSIETLSLHMALLLAASGGGYVLNAWISSFHIEILTAMSTWFYAMVLMAIFWSLICHAKIDYLFDDTVKNKLTGLLSDYLIVAAIMSIPIKLVMTYWVPMVIMFVLGFLFTVPAVYFSCKKYIRDYWFEKVLGPLGCLCGVYVTGMLLTKMADPDLKTPALKDYSLGYTLGSFVCVPVFAFLISSTYTQGTFFGMVAALILTILSVIPMVIVCRK